MPSLHDIFEKVQSQANTIKNIITETEGMRCKLQNLKLSNPDKSSNKKPAFDCRNSPFRKVKFCFKPEPEIKHAFLENNKGKPVTFRKLCKILVDYIQTNNLYNEGNIICDDFLKLITHTDTCSFFSLLKNIGKIIS